MSRARRADTAPERALRSELHRRGLRFRVQRKLVIDNRRRADIVFPVEKVAVFVDGCFWHMCPQHTSLPRANADFWLRKLEGNRARDRDTDARLVAAGWDAVRVWEHEDPAHAADEVERRVRARRRDPSSAG